MSSATVTGSDRVADQRSDQDLLTATISDDRGAFAALFRRHARVAYAAAFGVVQRREDAEESVQDAFFTLWQKRSNIQLFSDSLIPWIVVTARNHARNRIRASIRARTDALADHHEDADALLVEDPAITSELASRLELALSAITAVDRKLVELCLIDNLAYEDAAKKLNLSHGSVRNRLSRARSTMRATMRDLDEGTNS